MNQYLQNILDFIKQSENLSASEKKAISKAVGKTEDELANKKRDLEIESSLERVRAVALRMKKPDDMPEVCRVISEQMKSLNVKDIRNVQTAIFYEAKGTYMNYEYYARHRKTFITETSFTNHKIHKAFAAQMLKGKGKFYSTHIKGKKVKDWIAYQKTTNVFLDKYLEKAASLNYYWYSLGPVALGFSTYSPLNEEGTDLFRRFLNVFELSYRRYLDIEKAETQAREAKIESSLERVRAQAMGMKKPEDLLKICETLFREFNAFGFSGLRNAMINIHNEHSKTFVNYDYSDAIGKSTNNLDYDIHPVIEKQIKQMRSANDAFSETVFAGKDLASWKKFRKKIGEKDDPRINKAAALYYYFYSIGTGAIGISTFSPVTGENLALLKRFRNVFNLSYQRYTDIAQAEAQTREAQIEIALERVRSKAMAMHKSDDLNSAVAIVFEELDKLNLGILRCGIGILNKEKRSADVFMRAVSDKGKNVQVTGDESMDIHPLLQGAFKGWLRQEDASYVLQGNDLINYYKIMGTTNIKIPESQLNELAKKGLKHFYYVATFQAGGLFAFRETEFSEEAKSVLKRFSGVFNLTYKRFLDLQNAESQAREAQVQLAMERVRARTMAMQKSDELPETTFLLFQQLKDLGETAAQLSIGIIKEEDHIVELSAVVHGNQMVKSYDVPADDPFLMKKAVAAWKEKQGRFTIEIKGKKLKEYNKWRNNILKKKIIFSEDRWIVNIVFFSKGMMSFSSDKPISEDAFQLLERFAKVFEQTYIRFLDLQKAEAQAREAQVELALERVRAKTMAMQRSEDLKDAAALLFQQVKALGVPAYSCGYNIWEKNVKEFTSWMSSQDGSEINGIPNIPLTEDANFIRYVESKQKDEQFFVLELRGERMQEHYQYLKTIPAFKGYFDYAVSAGFDLPETQIHHLANFSRGNLLFITLEPCPQFHDVFKRFASVFEQTYTRFLDLQKAEAQARESQIELALERVRARTMAMHHSNELAETALLLFHQLRELGLEFWRTGFYIWRKDVDLVEVWSSNGDRILPPFLLSYKDDEGHRGIYEASLGGELSYEKVLAGDELEKHNQWFMSQPNAHLTVKQFDDPEYTRPDIQYKYAALFREGYLLMFSSQSQPQARDLLKRFAKVFEQSYTRFLDLQKAEAQSREAQIELALERVRARTMAMHKSEEFMEVINLVSEQLQLLNIVTHIAGFSLDYKAHPFNIWMAAPGQPYPSNIDVPYREIPMMQRIKGAIDSGLDFYADTFSFEEKNQWLDNVLENTIIKYASEERKKFMLSAIGLSITIVMQRQIALMMGNYAAIPYTDKENAILKRFSMVFEQTYTRYLDLQKAEAQAREAQIEAALEKVRGKAMAMHSSGDLSVTTSAVFTELRKLGVNPIRSGVALYTKDPPGATFYASTTSSENDELAIIGSQDVSVNPCLQMQYDSWMKKENYFPVLSGEELKEYYKALSIPPPDHSHPYEPFQHEEYGYYFNFSEGNFYAWTEQPFSEDEMNILKRFRSIIDLTFRRYLELQKAEAQAREAQIEASLEKVRGKAMAMHFTGDLSDAASMIFTELKRLGIMSIRIGVGLISEESHHVDWYSAVSSPSGDSLSLIGGMKLSGHPVLEQQYKSWLKKENYFAALKGDDLKAYYNAISSGINLSQDNNITSDYEECGHWLMFSEGFLFAWSDKEYSNAEIKILERFKNIVELTFRRYFELQKAEAQTREAQVEAGLERVRSRTLAMQKSDELAETAAVVFKQLINLGIEPNRLYIAIIKDESGNIEFWITDEDGRKVSTQFTGNKNRNLTIQKMYDGWTEQKKSISIDMQGKELEDYFHYLSEELKVPFKGGLTQKRRAQTIAYFSQGFIGIASPDPQSAETTHLLERFAYVFNLTYTRFNDLQLAEAQTREAKIEAALERVRARALAMQAPEELKDVAQVLRSEMGILGVEELETCSIYLHDDNSENAECWFAIKDSKYNENKMVTDHFELNLNDTWVGREMLKFYKSSKKKTSIIMKGADRSEWIHYCEQFAVHLRGFYGENIPDRTYHLYKFSHGTIGAATPGDISEESWSLLKRAASVFSLAYSRFKDLTQARVDLQNLKEEKKRAEDALKDLKATQTQLIQSEKMASLGELTAGIAHEIQNPLNFVNNFSEVNTELIEEMKEEIDKGNLEDVKSIANDISDNEQKINHHGKRAEAIVKGMLQHSRSSGGVKEPININALADEYLRLAYHGLRAKDKTFNAAMKTDYDETIGNINIIPQDIGRVILNLITNAFYVVTEKKRQQAEGYEPTVSVGTKREGDKIFISVKDNGYGIPQKVLDKIFQPFFTTKPTGQGTGLGLSLSYDIIKTHGGEIRVETKENEGTIFKVILPDNRDKA